MSGPGRDGDGTEPEVSKKQARDARTVGIQMCSIVLVSWHSAQEKFVFPSVSLHFHFPNFEIQTPKSV